MDIATKRKEAMKIESRLLGKLAVVGQHNLAKFLNMDEAAVTRMKHATGKQKHSFFQLMSMVMAILEVEAPESDVTQALLRIEKLLTKRKAPAATEANQISMEF